MTPREYLTDFLLRRIPEEPLHAQVMLYRSVAAENHSPLVRAECTKLADQLEAVERAHGRLVLQHQMKSAS